MSPKELIRRYTTFAVSIFLISLGVSVTVSSQLGTPPISSGPFVFSVNTPLSIGTYLLLLNLILIAVQVVLMGIKEVKRNKFDLLLQIPISILFGMCTDFSMWLLSDIYLGSYPVKMVALLIGCVILAVGIGLEVIAGVAMMSGEYTVQVVSKRFRIEFGTVKMLFDTTLVSIAIISSLLFSATVVGVREGTIIAALITGPLVKLVMPRLKFINKWHACTPQVSGVSYSASGAVLITISREYGSGGHAIGKMIAERLGIPFYDHNLVKMVAREGDFDEAFVSRNEQIISTSFYNMIMQDYEAPIEKSMSPEDLLFVAQSNVINRIAEQGSCVIVGRCASYILDRYPNNISIFLHADIDKKTVRAIKQYGLSADQAAAEIRRVDKARAEHFYHYTGKRWGDARSYQLCFDSGLLSPDEICDTVEKLYRRSLLNR